MIKDENGILVDPPMSEFFGLSYSSFLVLPRLLLEAMPLQWQKDMVKLMEEMNERFKDWVPEDHNLTVRLVRRDGKFARFPEDIRNYRRGDASLWEKGSGETV